MNRFLSQSLCDRTVHTVKQVCIDLDLCVRLHTMRSVGVLTQMCAVLLLPASGLLLYWLYRRSSESDEDVYGTQKVMTSRSTVIEVTVPQRAVGPVIGRQGATIKEIQKASGARVNFKDVSGNRHEAINRTCVIHGTLDAAHQAELMIQQIIADIPEPITEQIEVPGYTLGRIIGKGGSSIRELQSVSGARITVDKSQDMSGAQTLRTVTLTGSQAQIDVALDMIEEKLADEEKFRNKVSVMSSNRDERRNHGNQNRKEHLKTSQVGANDHTWDDTKEDLASKRQEKLPLTDGYLEVYVSALENPGHFWIQVIGSQALHLETLQSDLSSWVLTDDAKINFKVTQTIPGQLVAARFEPDDATYYRAKVLGESETGLLDLYFVDFGDNAFIDRDEVFKLRPDCETFPYQAVECGLYGVKPSDDKKWSEESLTMFEELSHCAQWKTLNAKVSSKVDKQSGFPLVQLFDSSGHKEVNIGDEMIEHGLAQRCEEERQLP